MLLVDYDGRPRNCLDPAALSLPTDDIHRAGIVSNHQLSLRIAATTAVEIRVILYDLRHRCREAPHIPLTHGKVKHFFFTGISLSHPFLHYRNIDDRVTVLIERLKN